MFHYLVGNVLKGIHMRHLLVFAFILGSVYLSSAPIALSQQPATPSSTAVTTTTKTSVEAPAVPAATPVPAVVAPAQPAPALDATTTTATAAPQTASSAVQDAGAMEFDDKKYVDPTYQNLAALYWALGILDVNNSILIDNFLAITECEMYMSYVNNDLEWKEIREVTRDFLRTNYKNFPTSFKITIPLYLGQYNADEEYFEVNQKRSATDTVRNIETIYYTKPVTCGLTADLEGYPRNLILYLNRPFSLSQLPVEKELARLFLDESATKNSRRTMDANRSTKRDDLDRMAFLELMFRVHSFKENKNTMGGFVKAVVYAQIDYIRVYADYEKQKLLYEKDMYEDETRKRRRRNGSITEDDLKLPDGPLFADPKKKTTATP